MNASLRLFSENGEMPDNLRSSSRKHVEKHNSWLEAKSKLHRCGGRL